MALATQTRRVRALEDGSGGGGDGCPRCGWGGDDEPFDFQEGDTFEIVFDDVPEEEEFCEACGRRVEVIIRFEEDLP